jgi:flagellar biosynthesis component FlhA
MIGIASLQKVLHLLLEEGVHIRDFRSIVESLAEHASVVSDAGELVRRIRIQLAPAIVQHIYGPAKMLEVLALEPELRERPRRSAALPWAWSASRRPVQGCRRPRPLPAGQRHRLS